MRSCAVAPIKAAGGDAYVAIAMARRPPPPEVKAIPGRGERACHAGASKRGASPAASARSGIAEEGSADGDLAPTRCGLAARAIRHTTTKPAAVHEGRGVLRWCFAYLRS